MKKQFAMMILISAVMACSFIFNVSAQDPGAIITVQTVNGAVKITGQFTLILPNGTLTRSGRKVTYAPDLTALSATNLTSGTVPDAPLTGANPSFSTMPIATAGRTTL